jgi:hypothetical protein
MRGYTRKKLEQLQNELTEKVLVKNADKAIRFIESVHWLQM